jgi:hypothetical protein
MSQHFVEIQMDLNVLNKQAFYNQLLLVDPLDSARNTVYLWSVFFRQNHGWR